MTSLKSLAAAASVAGLLATAAPAAAQVDQYVGSLFQFGMNWCPDGWLPANGQMVSVSQYQVLFSLFGTTYGGNGQTTFGLPDLSERMPVSYSSNLPIGAKVGSSTQTMLSPQLPMHSHGFNGDDTGPAGASPSGAMLGMFPNTSPVYAASTVTPATVMNPRMLQPAGGNQPINIQSPVLAVSWCVAYEGVYPQRP